MPEVVEVRKYADFLNKILKNKNIIEINILQGRYKKYGPFERYNQLKDKLPIKVLDIKTKGKFLYFILEDDYYIFSTLGLRGGWTYKLNEKYQFTTLVNNSYKKNALNHLNVEFKIDKGSIYYFDMLSFGTLKVVIGKDQLNKKLNSLAPDIMDITLDLFINQITKKNNLEKPIGNVLMNQKVISGIGNYLRSDILWLSHISPFTLVKNIDLIELKKIYKNALLITWGEYNYEEGLKLKKFNKKDKLPKDYDREFFVYNQKLDIYDNPIIKEELYEGSQKRFIYWVKSIQKN